MDFEVAKVIRTCPLLWWSKDFSSGFLFLHYSEFHMLLQPCIQVSLLNKHTVEALSCRVQVHRF